MAWWSFLKGLIKLFDKVFLCMVRIKDILGWIYCRYLYHLWNTVLIYVRIRYKSILLTSKIMVMMKEH